MNITILKLLIIVFCSAGIIISTICIIDVIQVWRYRKIFEGPSFYEKLTKELYKKLYDDIFSEEKGDVEDGNQIKKII